MKDINRKLVARKISQKHSGQRHYPTVIPTWVVFAERHGAAAPKVGIQTPLSRLGGMDSCLRRNDDPSCLSVLVANFILLALVTFLSGCISSTPGDFFRYQVQLKSIPQPPQLQVLLTAYNPDVAGAYRDNVAVRRSAPTASNQATTATIKITGPYAIYPYTPDRKSAFTAPTQSTTRPAETVKASVSDDGRINWGQVKLNQADVVIMPDSGLIQLGPRRYKGRLRVKVENGKLMLINIIDLESYLPGVVSSEMDESWPANALAAQAITARSFAFYRIKQSRLKTTALEYDLTDDIYSQVYRGEERTGPNTRRAVEETRGIILAYDGKIFNALFHDTCGGQTEPGELVFKLTPLPPLAGRLCGYCEQSKYSHWQAKYTQKEIVEALKLDNTARIENIMITRAAPGGHAIDIAIQIKGRDTALLMDAQKFRIALNPNRMRSTLCKITKTADGFEFTGKGWGHAVGMCQEGARGMTKSNSPPLGILEYYYPQAKVIKIY